MCEFLSAIVLQSGEVYARPEVSDSHEDLIGALALSDNGNGAFVRVEYSPPNRNYGDVDAYRFRVDHSDTPAWFTQAVREQAEANLRERVKHMIVDDDRRILLGGCWIVCGSPNIKRARSARIVLMYGSSKVDRMYDSSKVEIMYGSSKVDRMYDSSKVDRMYGSSKVESMYDSSKVDRMYGSSKVEIMYDSSKVDRMYDSSKVESMYGSSKVESMYGSSKVESMYGSSKVESMYDSSKVERMWGESRAARKPKQDNRTESTDTPA